MSFVSQVVPSSAHSVALSLLFVSPHLLMLDVGDPTMLGGIKYDKFSGSNWCKYGRL